MRLILAATALAAIALPAQAQRLDTRRVDIEKDDDQVRCGFNAYPELTLFEDRGAPKAYWTRDADDLAPNDVTRLTLIFLPGEDWRTPQDVTLSILSNGGRPLSSGSIASALLRVDGGITVPLRFILRGQAFLLAAGADARETILSMIDHSKRAEVDLLDANGTVVRSYHWDTSRLGDAVETVSVVGWSCTSP